MGQYDREVENAKGFLEWCKKNNFEASTIKTAEVTLKYWEEKNAEEAETCETCGKTFTDSGEIEHIKATGICMACCEEEHK